MKRVLDIVCLFLVVAFVCLNADAAPGNTKTFVPKNGDWNVADNWQPKGVPGRGDVVIIPSGASVTCSYSDGGINYITVENGATVVFSGALTIGDSHGGMTVNGNVTVNGTLTCDPLNIGETGKVVCESNIEIGNSHGGLVVDGYLKSKNGIRCAPLSVGENGEIDCGGDLTVNNGSANQGPTGSGVCDIKGNVSVSGNLGCGSLLVNQGSSLKVSGSAEINNGNNQNKNFPGELVLGGDVEIGGSLKAGDLSITDGSGATIDFGDININYDTEATKKILTLLENAGAYRAAKEYTWKGSVSNDWFDVRNWQVNGAVAQSLPAISDKIYIDDSSSKSPVITSKTKVALGKQVFIMGDNRTLTIEPGASLYAKYLYVERDSREGVLTINHRYDAMASLRLYSGRVIVGSRYYISNNEYKKVRVNKTLLTGVTYYLGSATSEGNFTGFNNLNATNRKNYDDLYSYDVATEVYTRSNKLSMTKGGSAYLYWKIDSDNDTHSERTISQVGSIQNCDENVTVYTNSYKDGDFGWNLIANPYQFSFPLSSGDQFLRKDIESVYFRRYKNGKYESVVYNFATGVSVPNTVGSDELYIAPQQGFFVKAYDGMFFKFVPSHVASGSTELMNTTLKSSSVNDDVLYLSLNSDKNGEDQTALVFRDGGTLNANPVDANKKMESVKNNQIYLMKDDAEYAIGFYPEMKNVFDEVLPLGVIVAQGSSVATIKALNLDEFASDADVYLYDIENNESYNMREQESVDFAVESGKRIEGRFAIGIKSNKSLEAEGETEEGTMTGVKENSNDVAILVAGEANGAKVSLVGAEKATVNVYDLAGRLVVKSEIDQGENHVIFGQVGGFYLVEVVAGNVTKSAKIAIK